MHQDADGAWHDECDWCLTEVINPTGPPFLPLVTLQMQPGERPATARWTICHECVVRMLKLAADVNWQSEAPKP